LNVSAEELRTGIILPLSGRGTNLGQAVRNGMEMAYSDLSDKGKKRLKLFFEDDRSEPKVAVSAFEKLINVNKVSFLINATSTTGKALSPLAEKAGVPFLSLSVDPEISRGKMNTFNFWVTPDELAKVAVAECQKQHYTKIAIVSTVHEGSRAFVDAFLRHAAGSFKIVLQEQFLPETTDFRSFITRLKANDVDAVLNQLYLGQAGLFAKQSQQLRFSIISFAFVNYADEKEVASAAGALRGHWYVDAVDPDAKFLRRYYERFPTASTIGAAYGYDAIQLLDRGLDQGATPEAVAEFLRTLVNFKGVMGSLSASGDNRFTIPAVVKQVR
jgi:branched-chain amino acid transport system substrate-binding protein